MKLIKNEQLEKNLVKLTVEVDKEAFDAAMTKSFKKNVKYIYPFVLLVCLYGIGLVLRGMFKGVCFENFLLPFILLV